MLPSADGENTAFLCRGSAADIWQTEDQQGGLIVLKKIRVTEGDIVTKRATSSTQPHYQTSGEGISWRNILTNIEAKVSAWSRLDHQNIVRVYRTSQELNVRVEFCAYGTVREYLRTPAGRQANKVQVVGNVIHGLRYLHGEGIVHGNLNAGKIFVDVNGRAKVGEFGLAALFYRVALWVPAITFEGFSRWMSPELLEVEFECDYTPTKESDLWALACVVWEITSERLPYTQYKHDIQVQDAILDGERPGEFDASFDGAYGAVFRTTLESCWSKDPSRRPSIGTLLERYFSVSSEWPKDTARRPSSARLSIGNLECLATPPTRTQNLSFSRDTIPLMDPTLPPTELKGVASGTSAQVSVSDTENNSGTNANKPSTLARGRLETHPRAPEKHGIRQIIGNNIERLKSVLRRPSSSHQSPRNPESLVASTTKLDNVAWGLLTDSMKALETNRDSLSSVKSAINTLTECVNMVEASSMNLMGGVQVDDARYNSSYSKTLRRRGCTAQTREAIHETLQNWTTNPESEKIYWMNGMAGTGKTTIAYSFCEWLESTHRLGASFFCSRISSTCRSLSQIIPTIACQLAQLSPVFYSRFYEILNDDPVIMKLNVTQQFEKLMYGPILAAKDAIPDDMVIVIDALDECDDSHSVRLLLDALFKFAEELPLKFFVASRPEPVIWDLMVSQGGSARRILYLHDIEESIVEEDIKKYLTEALGPMEPPLSLAQVEQLAKYSKNLFIYAATVVRYVYPDDLTVNSTARLELMLDAVSKSNGTNEDLDRLYTTVLSAVFNNRLEVYERVHMQRVLWTIVCAREPISVATVASLAELPERQVVSALQSLRSVVHVPESNSLISALHASFPEYMLDESRSKRFHCNEPKSNKTLVHRCFEVMKLELRFNICALKNSYLTDKEVPRLEARVSRCISPTLSYACRYWSSHLQLAPTAEDTGDILLEFLSNQLLFWMEVLSLSRCIRIGTLMMQQAQTWLQKINKNQDEIQKQVSDASNFITWFAANPCSQSTPHIYISALPFCAKSNWVYQHYSQRTRGLAGVSVSEHEEAVLATWNAKDKVLSLAISPEGDHIATGLDDGSIEIYDMHTGDMVAGPFRGHTHRVNSVTFSPSGINIASGSDDTTIIVWDALTGRATTGQIRGHTNSVLSVAFSPDGKHIVSGSADQTVIVWDSSTGAIVLGPLRGHTSFIWSVSLSPTGQLIASCSSDRSVRLWDAHTGRIVAELKGHTDDIFSIAFSPDGRRLASCSRDTTIRIWDVRTGIALGQPLTGHKDGIRSMAFSSDNVHIISGYLSGRITLWNTITGLPVLGPFAGHSSTVTSVVFSPGNSRIISCSDDTTIHTWDIQSKSRGSNQQNTHEVTVGPVSFLPNHTQIISNSPSGVLRLLDINTGKPTPPDFVGQPQLQIIHSLTVSSQGEHVAVGAHDGTIQVWDVLTGKAVSQPLKEHKQSIRSLNFSPDGTRLCSGSDDATIIVWGVETGRAVGEPYRGHTGAVVSVTYSPDGTLIASGGADCTVRTWDPSARVLTNRHYRHNDSVSSVVFSPDGSYIVSGSVDGAIWTWEVGDRHHSDLLSEPRHNQFPSHCISFSPDGGRLVSGFGDVIMLFDTITRTRIFEFHLPQSEQTHWISYSPDGTNIISASVSEEAPAHDPNKETNQQSPNIVRVWRADITHNQLTSSFSPRSWSYERNGCIFSPEGFVMWIPPDLSPHIKADTLFRSSIYHTLVLSPDAFINIGYPADLCIGERWTECYVHKD